MSDASRVNGLPEIGAAPGFTVVDKIAVQQGAVSGITASSDGSRLMVTHYGDDSVSSIDAGNGAVVQTVIDIDEPFAITMADTPQSRAYISTVSAAYDSILAFDLAANRVVGVHPVANSVTDLAVSPEGRYVYASRTAAQGADVAILDTKTGREDAIGIAAAAGTTAGCVRVSPDGRRLYVAANGPFAAELVVIDPHTHRVLNTFEIGCPIRDIALSPDGATAYVGSCGPDFGAVLDVLDTRTDTIVNTYKFGEITGLLAQLVLSRDGERAYLVGDTCVTVLSTSTHDIIGSIAVGAQPSCLTESPDGDRLYIADYAGAITVLTVAPTAADAPTQDEIPTAPHQWVMSNLLGLEPTPA
ncbi:MAG: YncE family protein [Mycobacterium sp.]|uniref:YncE family protein n=1 Tax=Mycobacterium sp. TaxID=1785 RepID=UPI003C68CF1B